MSLLVEEQRHHDDIYYLPRFLEPATADVLLDQLRKELDWNQQEIFLYGRTVKQPRLSCWYGDEDAHYTYSNLHLNPLPWHPALLLLKQQLEEKLGKPFNSVLANAYRDGQDSMGWHADDEKELGTKPVIASVSLGAGRRFLLRNRQQSAAKSLSIVLEHGSLLVMQNQAQVRFQHSLPKIKAPTGLRINLTYRHVRSKKT